MGYGREWQKTLLGEDVSAGQHYRWGIAAHAENAQKMSANRQGWIPSLPDAPASSDYAGNAGGGIAMHCVSGEVVLAIAEGDFSLPHAAQYAKRLFAHLLNEHCNLATMKSRRLWRDLRSLPAPRMTNALNPQMVLS